jgi:hypothetical protein
MSATLHRRIHGIGEANQEKQKLTVVQEWSLVQFILEAAEREFTLSHAQVVQYADAVRQATLGADCEGGGSEMGLRLPGLTPSRASALLEQGA